MEWNDVTMMIVGAYVLVNLVAMVMYAFDKHRARTGGGRISERSLLIVALLGPFGALIGMRAFHHKTRKALFLLVPLFVVLHLVLFYLLVFY
ncbi:MAG: DUF1294 domain-containing protein [Methanomassiliicoccales archaeon]|nr:DUF1294 domain-containing protein [Methanomassiliicoccales archaeon]